MIAKGVCNGWQCLRPKYYDIPCPVCTYGSLEQMGNTEIIEHYRNLWRVEQSFRMSKNDLEMRPIFHREERAIRVHLLICFMALAAGKYMELTTKRPLRRVLNALMEVTDAIITDESGKQIIMRSEIHEDVREILRCIGVTY